MSAYVVIESSVKDEEAMRLYAAGAGPSLKAAGAEFLVRGPWQVLAGEPYLTGGGILRFADKSAALSWYNSPEYQALHEVRTRAMDCRFRLLV